MKKIQAPCDRLGVPAYVSLLEMEVVCVVRELAASILRRYAKQEASLCSGEALLRAGEGSNEFGIMEGLVALGVEIELAVVLVE
ncbi:hypothetical protein [Ktedonobacter racemifer]|uniref:hypothetical protein n=1 Tax=Ktedonobacter racemifer TaxID=363277 RepID=UPI0012F97803|nr:hypothetical protein [Ktedonobacter racemifer]